MPLLPWMPSNLGGTFRSLFRLGKASDPTSVQLKNEGSKFGARDQTDAAYVRFAGADPVVADDFVTKRLVPRRDYGNSPTNPFAPPPAEGDVYYNTVLQMAMQYDAVRAKWLSVEAQEFTFGRNGNTGVGVYFQAGGGGRIFSATEGFYAFRTGTICSMAYTRTGAAAMTFSFAANGVVLTTVPSVAASGRSVGMNTDFVFGDILAVLNSAASASPANNVIGTFRVKWRV